MDYKIEVYKELTDSLIRLKIAVPAGLAFIPENIDSADRIEDCIYTDTLSDLRKFIRANQIEIIELTKSNGLYRARKSADWFGPTLFVSASVISGNSELISIALNVISDYVTDFFKGSGRNTKIKMDIIVETNNKGTYKRIKYEGDAKGLEDVSKIIDSLTR